MILMRLYLVIFRVLIDYDSSMSNLGDNENLPSLIWESHDILRSMI